MCVQESEMVNTVSVYEGDRLLGTADVSEDGRWSFSNVETPATGQYVFSAKTSNGGIVSNRRTINKVPLPPRPPQLEGFEDRPGGEIISTREFSTMILTKLSTRADTVVATDAYVKDLPFLTGFELVLQKRAEGNGMNCRVSLELNRWARSVKFAIGGGSSTSAMVWCKNYAGTVIWEGLTPDFGEAYSIWVEISPRPPYQNELIATIEIEEREVHRKAVYFDNFTLS